MRQNKEKKGDLGMNQVTVLLLKFLSAIISFAIGLDLFFSATITDILTFSLTVTIISYMIGERFILPRFGNASATMIDFLVTYMSVWIFGSILLNNYMQIAWGSIISAGILTGAEVLVHSYILSRSPEAEASESPGPLFNTNLAYNTEFAKEHEDNDEDDQSTDK